MSLLMTLDPGTYQDRRSVLPLHRARVALVVGGRYFLIDACARDSLRSIHACGSTRPRFAIHCPSCCHGWIAVMPWSHASGSPTP
jgi:hypothetical protein